MTRSTRMFTASLIASAALFASACDGPSGIFTDVGQVAPDRVDPEEQNANPVEEVIVDPSTGHVEVPNRADLTQPAAYPIDQLDGDPGSKTIRVQFTAQAGECTIHNATATEYDDRVEVALLQGLHPNVAAMTCMNVQEQQEIVLTLDAPLGSRQLIMSDGVQNPPRTTVPDEGAADGIDAASYVGLPILEATDRAQNAGVQWRVTRDGDEFFAGTADYRTDRLNFEVDNGTVTTATIG